MAPADADAAADATADPAPLHPHEAARLERVAAYPFIALSIQTTGIHPSTGRIITIDALTYNAAGDTDQEFHAVLNPETDPGPRHQHGLDVEEVEAGQAFAKVLKPLDRLIDGRTLVVHDAPYTWGFLVSEARRAMTAAARANRARSRNRGRGRRRRQKVGHVPAPVAIVDTLATARRQGVALADVRLLAVAAASGVAAPDFQASVERATRPEAESSRDVTRLTLELERAQNARAADGIGSAVPEDLRADRFGLQRSAVRVDAAESPRRHSNPGPWQRGQRLRQGMEFVVAPEITADPDEIIAAGVAAELNYVEKLSRETSLVVCNLHPAGAELANNSGLTGKAMHAHRKGIPLVSDEEFMRLLADVAEATADPAPQQQSRASVPNANNRSQRRRSRRSAGAPGSPNGNKKSAATGAGSGSHSGSSGSREDSGQRKRRRGSRGGNRRRRGNGGGSATPENK